jgi:hypothetical protein
MVVAADPRTKMEDKASHTLDESGEEGKGGDGAVGQVHHREGKGEGLGSTCLGFHRMERSGAVVGAGDGGGPVMSLT